MHIHIHIHISIVCIFLCVKHNGTHRCLQSNFSAPRRACEDAGKTAELLPVLDLTSRMATEMRPAKCQKEHIVLWYGDCGGAPPLMSFNATGFDICLHSFNIAYGGSDVFFNHLFF